MQNRLWNASLRLGLIVLASAGLVIGAEIVGVSVRPGFAQERDQREQRFTGRLGEESGRLEDGSYYDVYTLEAQAGQSFLIEMVSNEFDTYLMMFDAEGNKLAENNDGENGTNAQLSIAIPKTGQYAIVANSFQAGEAGAYSLRIRTIQSEMTRQISRQSNENAEADRLLSLGSEQFYRGQFRDALAFWETSLDLYRAIEDVQGEANALNNLGFASAFLGEHRTAIAYHEEALEIFRAIEDRQGESGALNGLGNISTFLGEHRTAIAYYELSLEISRTVEDRQREANALNNLGEAYRNLGEYREAIAYYEQSLEIVRAIEDVRGEAAALGNLGITSASLGEYREAIAYYEQALEISRAIEDRQGESNALMNLGLASASLGKYREAITYHEQALEIFRAIEDRQGEARALGNLGAGAVALGEYQEAITYHKNSLEIFQAIEDRQGEAGTLMNLGTVYLEIGEYREAIVYCGQSLEIARAIGNQQVEADALGNLGNAYLNLGEYQRSINYYKQSLTISREIGDRNGEATSLTNLGAIYLDTQQYSDAESVLYSAVEILEVLRDSELPDEDKVSLFETQIGSYMSLQQVLVAQNKTDPALEIAERSRARALVEFLGDRVSERNSEDITIPSLSGIQRVAQQQNATLVSYSIINLQNQDPLLYIWVIQPTGDISFQSVARSPLNTPLSDLITLSRSNLGVRSRNDGNIVSVLPPEELQRQREQQRQSLNDLYNILIAPIAEFLPTSEGDRIIFIPQGELFLVPFAALVDTNDQYLIENHTISISPSIQTLSLTRQLQDPNGSLTDNPLIVGNPTMPRLWNPETNTEERLPYLEGAENEAVAIAQQLNTEALLWDNASETRVAQQMQNASLIHLATHGLLDYGTPAETGIRDVPGAIALAPDSTNDGLLTSDEISAMELQANLVVLSACDTGRGTITSDGVIGLSRSLMQAGVPSVVVSLWSVPDDSTEFLMKEFYANLEEMDKAQALRQAMLSTMQQPEYTEPLDWAAFTLIGEAN